MSKVLIGSIIGPQGIPGPEGPEGPEGPAGPPGPAPDSTGAVAGQFLSYDGTNLVWISVPSSLPDPEGNPEGYVLTITDGYWEARPPTGGGGRELEIRASSTHIQRRYVGDTAWTDVIALSELRGAPGTNGTNGTNGSNGESIQMRVNGGYFQVKYPSQTLWTNITPDIPAGAVIQVSWDGTAWGDRPTARTDVTVWWVGGPSTSVPASAVGTDIHWPDAA